MENRNNPDTDRILRRINESDYKHTCAFYIALGVTFFGISIALILNATSTSHDQYAGYKIVGGLLLLVVSLYIVLLNDFFACLSLTKRRVRLMGLLALKIWLFSFRVSFILLIPAFIALSIGNLFGTDCSGYIIMSMTFFLLSAIFIYLSQYWDGVENAKYKDVVLEEMLQQS